MASPAALAARATHNGNVEREGIIVRQVWQTEEDWASKTPGRCLRGLIVRYGQRPRCTGIECQHDPNY